MDQSSPIYNVSIINIILNYNPNIQLYNLFVNN